ncbi:MAG: Sapep family Mn(2+)-dependent dipeptidase [Firmicutes bacterium]|nr:Sapep family Mn(2+)-dependent dipeptidase [Bacillota bacterium]
MNAELDRFLTKHEQKMHEDLQDFVAIPSVSEDKEKVREALRYILDLARSYGLKAESFLDEQVGVIEMGEGDETLGILAHVDVVPPGDPAEWTFDPFDAVDCEGRMYGRGTIDDKGMVLASLYAMMAVKSLGQPLKKKVQLILGTQEEVEWTDMDAYVKAYPLPDYGFTPDGEYPICNIEKGIVDQVMEFDYTKEPAPEGLHLIGLNIGIANNVVPGTAEAVLSDGRVITARGHDCHSSIPEHGENAIFKLAEELKGLGLAENSLLKLILDVTETFSDWEGKDIGLKSESEYYQGEFVHRNTIAPTILKADGGIAKLVIDVRFPYGESMERIEETLDKWATDRGGHTVMTDALPATFVSRERPFLKVFEDAYEDVTGLINEFTVAYGGSYAKAMPNIVSWGPLFPGEEDTCHMPNEYIDLENMMLSAKIFAESIAQIVLTDKSFK